MWNIWLEFVILADHKDAFPFDSNFDVTPDLFHVEHWLCIDVLGRLGERQLAFGLAMKSRCGEFLLNEKLSLK